MKITQQNFLALLAFALATFSHADVYNTEWENVAVNNAAGPKAEAEIQGSAVSQRQMDAQKAEEAEKMRTASAVHVRRFHEVIDELFAEFGYDVRMGQLNGLQNLAIRKVEVSEALPHTYQNYIELLIAERIRENSRVRLLSCTACKTKTSRLVEGRLLITSPTTNMAQMRLAADQLGVENFMDAILVYHSTHMVLAVQIFNTSSQELVWARTYNSETIKSRYQKLAIDYKQVEKSRPGDDYVPEYRFLFGVGGGVIPNVSGDPEDTGVASLLVRGTEKFNNRKQEFGLQLNTFITKNSILSEHPTESGEEGASLLAEGDGTATPEAWTMAIGLYGIFTHNFLGELESYNRVRHGCNVSLGFLLAAAYLAPTLRLGWDTYFGKRFAGFFGLYYVAPSKVLIDSEFQPVAGGVGGELGLAINL